MESKKDFSLFSKARTKQALAHTCKNDKILESTKTTDSTNSTNQTIQNLESKITHPKPCTHPVLVENLESSNCCIERSEISSMESQQDFSCLRTQNDKNLESKAFYESILYFLNLESSNCCIERSEISSMESQQDFSCLRTQNDKNLESKAFYESILYFLREYKTHNNNDLKYIILTNTRDFYLIEAEQYRKFADDKTIIGYFNNCDGKEGVNKTTQKFYDDIKLYRDFYLIEAEQYRKFADDKTIIGYFNNCDGKEGVNKTTQKFYDDIKLYLPTLNATLKFTYFHIQNTPLALLYQALSPQVLLKRKNCIDANTLNQNFYDELLYILGLKEISQNSKVLIQANDIKNTLLDSITKAFQLSPQDDFELYSRLKRDKSKF